MKSVLVMTAATAALGLAATTATSAFAEDTVSDAFAASKPIFESSLRSEHVDQFGIANEADALTWRNRFGFTTGEFKNFKLLVEVDNTNALVSDYNSTLNGKTTFPNVVDPAVTEINR